LRLRAPEPAGAGDDGQRRDNGERDERRGEEPGAAPSTRPRGAP